MLQATGQQNHPAMSPLHVLTSLVDLNVADNKFNSTSTLIVFTKAGFPRLVSLDVRGNTLPAEEEALELVRIGSVRFR